MILGFEIGMAIVGLIALFSGRFPLTNRRIVRGVSARLLGIAALAPFPLAFVIAFLVIIRAAAQGREIDPKDPMFLWIEGTSVGICALLVFGLGYLLSEEVIPPAPVTREEDPYGTDRLENRDENTRTIPFNAKAVFTFKADRRYRIYGDVENLYFVHLAGQYNLIANLAQADPTMIRDMDRSSPKDLVGNHKHDFVLPIDQLTTATIAPPSFWGGHGKHTGSLTLLLKDGSKWNLQFEDITDMQAAIASLPRVLGVKVIVTAKWDAGKQKYVS